MLLSAGVLILLLGGAFALGPVQDRGHRHVSHTEGAGPRRQAVVEAAAGDVKGQRPRQLEADVDRGGERLDPLPVARDKVLHIGGLCPPRHHDLHVEGRAHLQQQAARTRTAANAKALPIETAGGFGSQQRQLFGHKDR